MKKAKLDKIIVILGPTASGKSDLAIKIAKKYNGEIISADSRQIYRGMDIGTGKVTGSLEPVILSERRESKDLVFISEGIPHHLIDVAGPNDDFNVSHFKKLSEKITEDILRRGKLPIICGGTGFWIKSIVDDISYPEVIPDKKLRERLSILSADELFAKLKKIDPRRAGNIDPNNKVRLIRAIEICSRLGTVPVLKARSYKLKASKYEFLQIGIDIPKEKLHKNIKKRLKQRLENGMIEEVQYLHKSEVSWKRLEYFGLEYRWIGRYLQKKISVEEMDEKLYLDIIHYAKRQMTWFRKDKRIIWIKNQKISDVLIQKFLK